MKIPIISHSEAKSLGLKYYFTGNPCNNGHLSERFTCNRCCIKCGPEWKKNNPESIAKSKKISDKKYREKNREKRLISNREAGRIWRQKNPEKLYIKGKLYRETNKDKFAAWDAKRRAAELKATPSWADTELMQKFYTESRLLTLEVGISHQVDHIVPLQNDLVCGLHNQFNLQVLTKKENLEKGNRFWPDMSLWTPELRQLVKEFREQK